MSLITARGTQASGNVNAFIPEVLGSPGTTASLSSSMIQYSSTTAVGGVFPVVSFTGIGLDTDGGTITEVDFGYGSLGNIFAITGVNLPVSLLSAYLANTDYNGLTHYVIGDNATFVADGGGDSIQFYNGDNTAILATSVGPGIDTIVGGTGNNQVALTTTFKLLDPLSGSPLTGATITTAGANTLLSNVTTIRYLDGATYYGAQTPGAEVYRLYEATLDRAPDPAGFGLFSTDIANGAQVTDVANVLVGSPEFQAQYGALDNTGFVNLTYQNVLHRPADGAGLQFFVNALDNGASRASVITGFSESAEFVSDTTPAVSAGLFAPDPTAVNVLEFYQTAFNRLPDAAGLAGWISQRNGGLTQDAMAASFVNSGESQAIYGGLSNADFVNKLYSNTLGRAGDAAGISYWNGLLDTGATRAQVLTGFATSPEELARLQPFYQTGIVTSG